ncbi:Metallo-hydrolase/oxidoreductase [Teratosphaeria nubilosa]|uniref:Metallo-hydrolase/oxidoreductase n=1 Tax=Teratosphaeria nubilosa TaxID=161662 RepID=A0A6G1LAR9_9PEZI|nr:Metallo-hydrolase/oxidoreductase [Teratosphaeria nubilosa]
MSIASSKIQEQVDGGAIPAYVANVAPKGTKMWLLEVGWLEADEAFIVRGGNTSLKSTADQGFVNKRRQLPIPELSDVFARVRYGPEHELEAAINATGHKLEDVKKIIIGHLHLDHAGGSDVFMDRQDIEIWTHDVELRSAFWSVTTGADAGVYQQHYLNLGLNWKTFDDRTRDFCQGITLHHLPGHTEGLIGMQVNLQESGTFIFISDHCHVIENRWHTGWLARNHPAWFSSTQRLRQLERHTRGRIIPGHDEETLLALQKEAAQQP